MNWYRKCLCRLSDSDLRGVINPLLLLACLFSLVGCEQQPHPAEKTDSDTWIPIADTAFLVPNKTWLKSYGRKKTDGAVSSISLHSTAPEVLPWSQERHDQMYPKLGRGKVIEINVMIPAEGSVFHKRFPVFPQSYWGQGELVEVPADLEINGFHKFKERWSNGMIRESKVFYEYVRDGKVTYFYICDDDGDKRGGDNQCVLKFPYGEKLVVTLRFRRFYLAESASMADKVTEKLREFESAGQARLAERRKD